MTVHVSASALARARASSCGVDAESHASTANLSSVTLARHVARSRVESRASIELVATEALSTIFGAGHGITCIGAVCNALGVGDSMLTHVGKSDAVQHAIR